jgi:hypothetical protein
LWESIPITTGESLIARKPFRYFIRSQKFLEQFSSITEADTLEMIRRYCPWNKRGPLGEKELLLTDDN